MAEAAQNRFKGAGLTTQDQLAMAGQLRQEKSGEGEKAEPVEEAADKQPRSLREAVMAKKIEEEKKSKMVENIAASPRAWPGKLKTKLLSAIPGYGIYIIFKRFVGVKKTKLDIIDIIIMLFSNLTAFFVVLVVLVLIVILADIIAHPISTAWSFAWGWIGEAFKASLNI